MKVIQEIVSVLNNQKEELLKYINDNKDLYEGRITANELPIHTVGSTIGTHVGPGAIAVAFFEK